MNKGLVPFPRGTSGNPGGRPSIAKALAANGTDTTKLTAELCQQLLTGMRELDPGTVAGGASWRFCVDKLLSYVVGLPKAIASVDVDEYTATQQAAAQMTDAQLRDALRAALVEQVRATFGDRAAEALLDGQSQVVSSQRGDDVDR